MIKITIMIISTIILLLVINEFTQGLRRQKNRQNIYKQAQFRANNISKPLVVYGDPYYGLGSRFFNIFMEGYGCGDETVDLTGCPGCPNGVKSDILSHLKNSKSDSKVIFISCVLEYVDDIDEIITEIKRVAGSFDNVFIVTVGSSSLSSYLYREDDYKAKQIVYAPPKYPDIQYKKFVL